MKTLIIISCILTSGTTWQPRGHYKDWKQCASNVRKFERKALRSARLCWCHRKGYAYRYTNLDTQ